MGERVKEAKVRIKDKTFLIKGRCVGSVKSFPYQEDGYPHFKFRIVVKNLENGRWTWFYFYGSYAEFEKGKTELTKEDLVIAFKCFLEDCLAVLDYPDVDDFANAFGYDKPSIVLKVYKACERALRKAKKLGLEEDEIYDLINEIIEKENEDRIYDLVIA